MRPILPLLLLAAPALPLSAQSRSGAYLARQGAVEITRETYRFDGRTLTARVDIPLRGLRLETRTEFTERLSPSRYHAAVRGPSGTTLLQDVAAVFGDSVAWTIRAGTETRTGATAIAPPYAVIQNLMFSHLAVALRRYNRVAGGTQVMNVWLPEGDRVAQLRMTFRGDSGQVEMAGVTMIARLDAQGWLRGLRVPAQSLTVEWREDLPPAAAARGTADTVAPADVREETLSFQSGAVELQGTLVLPARPAPRIPAVVIVAGSGPTDRDGNSLSVRSNLYAQLAWRLAQRGIGSLRYDKRGAGASRMTSGLAAVTLDDFAADAAAAVRRLQGDARFGPVVLAGHSEGGWVALGAVNAGAAVAGIALLSVPGRPIAELLAEQLTFQVDSGASRQFGVLFPRYLAGETLANVPDALQPLLLPVNQTFMKSLAAFNPAAEIAKVTVPVLIVQGAQDIQVGVRDARMLKAAQPNASLVVIPGVNHLFKSAATRDRMIQLAIYADPTIPVTGRLVDELVKWLGTVSPRRAAPRP